jgi:cytochrome c biogenesis protein CcmG/thiol:disulfide interchange protein DsbE
MSVPQPGVRAKALVTRRVGRAHGWLLALLAGLVLALVAISWIVLPTIWREMRDHAPQGAAHPALGKRLPLLALEPLTGGGSPVRLEDLAGKVVLVNFWGTWCPPCRTELPHLVALAKEFGQHPNFRIYLVSCAPGRDEDLDDLKQDTEKFLAQMNYDVPAYADPDLKTRLAFHRVATLRGFPTTFVLDGQGVLRGIWSGYNPKVPGEIRRLVTELLGPPS